MDKSATIALATTLVLLLLPVQITFAQPCNSEKQNQTGTQQPLPLYKNSLVFFFGTCHILDYNATYPSLTVRPEGNVIKGFCLQKPWFFSAGSNLVVNIHIYHGIVRPAPVTEGETIHFLFVFAKNVIIMLP